MKLITTIFLLFFCFGLVAAQNSRIHGQVTTEDNQILANVFVELMELSLTTLTDAQGYYEFEVKEGAYTLQYSYVGFESIQEKILVEKGASVLVNIEFAATNYKDVAIVVNEEAALSIDQKTSLDGQFFEENAQGTFAKSLEKVTGVNAINVGVGIAKPVIRGLSFNRIVVNNNGIKQEGQQWGADHGLEIDQFGVDRIEIIKGAASLRYGSDALGGAVNILPNKIIPKNRIKASLLGIYKTNNQHAGMSASVAGRISDFFFDARFSYQDFGDYRVPAEVFVYNEFVLPIYNQQLKNTAGKERNIRASLGLIKDWGVSRLTFSHYYLNAGIFSGAVGIPRSYALDIDGNDRDIDVPSQQVNHFSLVWNNDLTIKQHRLQLNIGYQNNLRQEYSFPHYHQLPPTDNSDVALQLNLQTVSGDLIFTQNVNKKWKHVYGGSFQYQINQRAGFEFLLPNFQTVRTGGYWFGTFKPNKRWVLSAGLRLDYAYNYNDKYAQAVYGERQTIQYLPKVAMNQQHFFNYAAALGMNYVLRKDVWNFQVNLGKSYRVPYPSETAANGIHHGTFRHEMGTPDLKPEHGYQLELSSHIKWKTVQATITGFGNYFQQYIYLSPTGKFSTLPEAGQLYQYVQTDAIYAGGELDWSWQPVPELTLRQGYEYVWNVNLQTQLGLPFTPPASILSEVRYEWKKLGFLENIYAQITHRYSFAQNRTDRNEPKTPAYHLLDAGLGFKIRIRKQVIQIGVQAQNLLNTAYLNHLSRYRILEIPEQGRNFVVTLKVPLEFALK
ncbi:TonB-dependent receptor [Aureispira sp. CCB-QB1]|uniref:TonB-dependent receptor n=1 Tax=Aureispira sp. CCB-QB1 TaxID=1313421 RepID=UPI000698D118|nr:TonB-dependent receptor [Aureispira sp. CCB-QB1]